MFFYPNQPVVTSYGVGRVVCHDYTTKLVHVMHRSSEHAWHVKKHHQDDVQEYEGCLWAMRDPFQSSNNIYIQYYRY